jgi:hypothetical protein
MEVFDFRSYESDKEKNRDRRFLVVLLIGASLAGLCFGFAFGLA